MAYSSPARLSEEDRFGIARGSIAVQPVGHHARGVSGAIRDRNWCRVTRNGLRLGAARTRPPERRGRRAVG